MQNFISLRDLITAWDEPLIAPADGDAVLDRIGVEDFDLRELPEGISLRLDLVFDGELGLELPGVPDLGLFLGRADAPTRLDCLVRLGDRTLIEIGNLDVILRLPAGLLRPMQRVGDGYLPLTLDDGRPPPYELALAGIGVAYSPGSGAVPMGPLPRLDLPPAILGSTGLLIEATGVALHLDPEALPPPGQDPGFRGLAIAEAEIHLPAGLSLAPGLLRISDCAIGSGGFTGALAADWSAQPVAAELFGANLALERAGIGLVQNALTEFNLVGTLTLPFFDQPLAVALSIDLDGEWMISLGAADGLATLRAEGLFEIELDGFTAGVEDGVLVFALSGELRPLVGDIEWPSFRVEALSIDSRGRVRIDGGWIDLRDQAAFELYGFRTEVARLAFGSEDDGSHWIGFSASIAFVDELSIGGSVEGMRIHWLPGEAPGVSIEGVGVELDIPDVLYASGRVRLLHEELLVDGVAHEVDLFRGDLNLELYPLDLRLDAALAIGRIPPKDAIALYLYLGLELPAGVPLGPTGLGLYGMAGLFAMNMAPNKTDDEDWYNGWYKGPGSAGRAGPPSATRADRWGIRAGGVGLGAGLTLGSLGDNGYAVNGRMLLVLAFPGPVILLEGRANILRARASLNDEPMFRALMVIDAQAGSVLVNVAADYALPGSGDILEIAGNAEAFFDSDPNGWYLHLGERTPIERRIRSTILKLFESNGYFMLDPRAVAAGAWIGYDRRWTFGPLKVYLSAFIEGGAVMAFKPVQFHGELHLHGDLGLKVWEFGLRLVADARLMADVPNPFRVCGAFEVRIEPPWPIPDASARIELCWDGPADLPPLPLPVREVAVTHALTGGSWPLPRGGQAPLLLPNWDQAGDGFIPAAWEGTRQPVDPAAEAAALARAPVVPMDARLEITFARPVADTAGVGDPPPDGDGVEPVGDTRLGYSLLDIGLYRHDGNAWVQTPLAAAPPAGGEPLLGAWEPVLDADGHSVGAKLALNTRTALSFGRNISSRYREWLERQPTYPCPAEPQPVTRCRDFMGLPAGYRLANPFVHPDDPELRIEQPGGAAFFSVEDTSPDGISGLSQAIEVADAAVSSLVIDLPADISGLVLHLLAEDTGGGEDLVWTLATRGGKTLTGSQSYPLIDKPDPKRDSRQPLTLKLPGGGVRVTLSGKRFWLYGLCWTRVPSLADWTSYQARLDRLTRYAEHFEAQGAVLIPDSSYRLRIRTEVEDHNRGGRRTELIEQAYFRTQGPPALARLSPTSPPIAERGGEPLANLTAYVAATLPSHGTRPVHRAFDLGVRFGAGHVELMYALAGRDLGLYLFDQNGEPVRDAEGGLVVPRNAWVDPAVFQATRTESGEVWQRRIAAAECVEPQEGTRQLPNQTVAAFPGQVLAPGAFHEARLVPLLLHDRFDGAQLDPAWQGHDPANPREASASRWQTGSDPETGQGYLSQTTNIQAGDTDADAVEKPGSMLVRGALDWTDYRLSVVVRPVDKDAFGLVVRWQDPARFYRFSWDAERRRRRLTLHANGQVRLLAEDQIGYEGERDYELAIETVGDALAVFIDGRRVFAVQDATLATGAIGLYCWAQVGVRFSALRVDDLRAGAQPVAYSWQFVTSRYADLRHQLHSHDERVWDQPLAGAQVLASAYPRAGAPDAPPASTEAADYESIQAQVFGQGPRELPERTEVTRLSDGAGTPLGWLIECPEPVDWARTSVQLLASTRPRVGQPPRSPLKLIGAALANPSDDPNEEWVDVLVRDGVDLDGVRIEYLLRPGHISADRAEAIHRRLAFRDAADELLFSSPRGPNALDHWEPLHLGAPGPIDWRLDGDMLVQLSNYGGEPIGALGPDYPGTVLLGGDLGWGDYRLELELSTPDNDGLGVLFRYRDPAHYYRWSMDRQKGYRRLLRRWADQVEVLWEDAVPYDIDRWYRLRIECLGRRLLVYLDEQLIADVDDAATRLTTGRIGLYSWCSSGPRFRRIRVTPLASPYLLTEHDEQAGPFRQLTIVDDGNARGPSQWRVEDRVLHQVSEIYSPAEPEARLGTSALAGDPAWQDYRVSVRVASDDDDDVGLMFRIVDGNNYYRFAINRQIGYRRLVRFENGQFQVLWEDNWRYAYGQVYALAVECRGDRIDLYQDGQALAQIQDPTHPNGRVALYCWALPSAHFHALRVDPIGGGTPLFQLRLDQGPLETMAIEDPGTLDGPSRWLLEATGIAQRSGIHTNHQPHAPGTIALIGRPDWTDYRIETRIRTDGPGAIGVVLRYANAQSFCRLAFQALPGQRAVARLLAMDHGSARVIWEQPIALLIGQAYALAVSALGSRLWATLDGQTLFDLQHEGCACGRAGLYAFANPEAHFLGLRITDLGRRLGELRLLDQGAIGTGSHWSIGGGLLEQRGTIDRTDPNLHGAGSYALLDAPPPADLRVAVRLRSERDGPIGAVFRWQDCRNLYRFSMDRGTPRRALECCRGGSWSTLWTDNAPYQQGVDYELVIDLVGPRLIGRLDGIQLFDLIDATHASGRVGLYCRANDYVVFRDLRLTEPPLIAYRLFASAFAAGSTAGFGFVQQSGTAPAMHWGVVDATLRQDAPNADGSGARRGALALAGRTDWADLLLRVRLGSHGDDGDIGLVFRYTDTDNHYRFSLSARDPSRRLISRIGGVQQTLWEDLENGYQPGRYYELVIRALGEQLTGYLDGVPLFRVRDAGLPHGRVGLYTHANTGARFSRVEVWPGWVGLGRVLWEEPFGDGLAERWQVLDQGRIGGSLWAMSDAAITQSGNIWGGSFAATNIEMPGTLALAAPADLADCRLVVRLASVGNDDMGVVFRWRDPGNYYRVSLNAQFGYRRLIRCVDGRCEILAEQPRGYLSDRDYLLTIDAFGELIRVFLDGEPLFDARDTSHSEGKIGLHAWSNTGLRVTGVRVEQGQWALFHGLGERPRAADGTLLRIHGGPPAGLPVEPGLERLHAGQAGLAAEPQLPAEGTDLRLTRGGETLHRCAVLPDQAYGYQACRLLRRADGTACFVLPTGPVNEASHRLRLRYQRDISATDPEAAILTREGDSRDELVILDLDGS